ncbi:MAG: RNA 3'-terminal-phosphate cyclase [Deltaproteobacteria bacterium RBG_16_54_11]|nr:MAG: RNA 3'-terminal-phosphate cyclase [Deltaproteobacteria bacterium RBG_16_54_11]
MIEVDGSYGEGGGQILRTAVALAAYLETPCRIRNIRKGRPTPGVRPQHEAGVKALAALCNAEVAGLHAGSGEVTIKPGRIAGGNLRIDVGTAGAIGLILQAMMLPATKALSPLLLFIRGGTDVPWAPTIGYVQEVTLPILALMGYSGEVALTKRGYFPRGGGEVSVASQRADLTSLQLLERGTIRMIRGRSHASDALRQRRVAERQQESAMACLKKAGVPCEIEVEYRPAASPGSGIDLWALAKNTVLGANALGARGKRAEDVGEEAAAALLRQLNSGAALDEWMGDQILPFLAVARGESTISTARITDHLRTNLWVINHFLPLETQIKEEKTRAIVTMRCLR